MPPPLSMGSSGECLCPDGLCLPLPGHPQSHTWSHSILPRTRHSPGILRFPVSEVRIRPAPKAGSSRIVLDLLAEQSAPLLTAHTAPQIEPAAAWVHLANGQQPPHLNPAKSFTGLHPAPRMPLSVHLFANPVFPQTFLPPPTARARPTGPPVLCSWLLGSSNGQNWIGWSGFLYNSHSPSVVVAPATPVSSGSWLETQSPKPYPRARLYIITAPGNSDAPEALSSPAFLGPLARQRLLQDDEPISPPGRVQASTGSHAQTRDAAFDSASGTEEGLVKRQKSFSVDPGPSPAVQNLKRVVHKNPGCSEVPLSKEAGSLTLRGREVGKISLFPP